MIATLDLRDMNIKDIPDVIEAVQIGRYITPGLRSIIISPSQQESLIICDETLYRHTRKLCREHGQSLREATVMMVIEGCRVEVE